MWNGPTLPWRVCGLSEPWDFPMLIWNHVWGWLKAPGHYDAQPVFKGTSSTIHNEMLDCMYEVYREWNTMQVTKTSFVAGQVDETTNVQSLYKLRIKLLWAGRTPSKVYWSRKVRGQVDYTYTWWCCHVHSIQTLMNETYPNAHFIHWCAHQLNLTLQQLCSARVSILRVFFAVLTAFAIFSSLSQKRAADPTQRCILRPPDAWWNFKVELSRQSERTA